MGFDLRHGPVPYDTKIRINFLTTFPKLFFTNELLPTRFQVLLYLISNRHYFVFVGYRPGMEKTHSKRHEPSSSLGSMISMVIDGTNDAAKMRLLTLLIEIS